MTGKSQADSVQSRQAVFVRCCLSYTSRQSGNANQIFYLGTNGYNAITFTCSTLSNSYRLTVFHGHGGPGFISAVQPDGSKHTMYSENKPSGSYKYTAVSNVTNSNSYIVFISCNSAEDAADRRSLVSVAYESGANCVTGFSNEVGDGEEYFEIVFQLVASDPNTTLATALSEANMRFGDVLSDNSPANAFNRVTLGYTDFSFNMN